MVIRLSLKYNYRHPNILISAYTVLIFGFSLEKGTGAKVDHYPLCPSSHHPRSYLFPLTEYAGF
jgi:hypothetical protein